MQRVSGNWLSSINRRQRKRGWIRKRIQAVRKPLGNQIDSRLILQEMGFQAGQHEIIAESLGKIIPRDIQNKVKQIR